MSRIKASIDVAVKRCRGKIHQTRLKKLNRSTSCQEAIEDSETFLIDPPSCREGVEIAIRNSLSLKQLCRDCDNDRHFFSLFLGQTRMILTLDLETQFLKVLNTF